MPPRRSSNVQALKDVLRGLVWAEEALNGQLVDFARFFEELVGAIEATESSFNPS